MSSVPSASGELLLLAKQAGLAADWADARGRPQRVAPQTLRMLLAALGLQAGSRAQIRDSLDLLRRERASDKSRFRTALSGEPIELPADCAGAYVLEAEDGSLRHGRLEASAGGLCRLRAPAVPGYYRLRLYRDAETVLAVAPRAPRPFGPLAGKAGAWGVAAQVYSLRHEAADPARRTLGHGDFGAVRTLALQAAAAGADVLALGPMHAMFSADPDNCSPYSPSSRLMLNVLYADPAAVLGEDFVRAELARQPVRQWITQDRHALIDWRRAGQARLALLRALHARFLSHPPDGLALRLAAFRRKAGAALEHHALFEAVHAVISAGRGAPAPWQSWSPALRDAGAAALAAFARQHRREIDFHCFAQWLADASLEQAHAAATQGGMRIGLLADLAVGCSPQGSQVWSRPGEYLRHATVGAPPDIHNPAGQCWGLAAGSPRALRARCYAPHIELLRANLAHAGGLRIDHALGLRRLWMIPDGAGPGDGAYLNYPAEDLLRITALEAWRRRALVIGENLGTVPEGFDQALHAHGVAGMNVLWFQRDPAARDPQPFLPPRAWPADSVAMATTHDLPTLCGWWEGRDLYWKRKLGADVGALRIQRRRDRRALWRALAGGGEPPAAAPLERLLAHVASAPCALALVALEDLQGVREQPNLPGTTRGHPNWRRRLPLHAGSGFGEPPLRQRVDAFRLARRSA